MANVTIPEIERRNIKKTTSGDIEYFDFDYSDHFDAGDTINSASISVTIDPSGEVTEQSADRIVSLLNVRCLFKVKDGILGKEYLIAVKAVTTNNKEKTLQLIICVI